MPVTPCCTQNKNGANFIGPNSLPFRKTHPPTDPQRFEVVTLLWQPKMGRSYPLVVKKV